MNGNNESETVVGRHWHARDDGALQCDLCPHHCRLAEGRRGLCFVRANEGGRVVLTSGMRVSGMAIDPIEKKPLYHFLPGTSSLSVGTIGCNLACKFCQNFHISNPTDDSMLGEEARPDEVARAAQRAGCPSVSFTYNEPIVTFEHTLAMAAACRARGLKTVAVTAGYLEPEPRREFFAAMDAANVDLKGFSEDFYRRLCGARLQPVLDTLVYLRRETRVWLELTTLLIPGENDSPAELDALTRWVVANLGPDVPLHFSAFHPMHKLLDHPPTDPAAVTRAREIARKNGVCHAYSGNVRDDEGSTTFCSGCGREIVVRSGYRVVSLGVDAAGACAHCGTVCAGLQFGHSTTSK